MAITAAAVECELREVLLADKPEAMLALSSKGTVPVLQVQEGRVIDESLDVMYWALQQHDPENWLQLDLQQFDSLVGLNDGDFKHNLDRYKYHVRFPEQSQHEYRLQAENFLVNIESKLEAHKGQGLLTDRHTLADIAVFPFIRQFSKVEIDWFNTSPYQLTRQWLQDFENSERFKRVMKKYPLWKPGAETLYFPSASAGAS